MARKPLSADEKEHGRQLGLLLAKRREARLSSAPELAIASDVSIDTVRSLEGGRVPTPTFLTVARLAAALDISLDKLHADATQAVAMSGNEQAAS
jgi:transcriptional regulator with XRE-family HTH domain